MRIAIIGPGLIGHSIALATRRGDPAADIIEIDRGDSITPARGADLVVLAAPIDAILHILNTHAHVLCGSVIVDTGSTKRAIVRAAADAGLETFVGGHPMAGAATSGAESAREDLFDGRRWFLVRGGAHESAYRAVERFVNSLGAEAIAMADDGSEHDRAMAAVSHLPQVVASALMLVAAERAGARLGWAGPGLRDTTRLAQSHASVWQSILATNADEVRPLLQLLAEQLRFIADGLEDPQTIAEFLARANRARATLDQ
jgi:prephenate dehydrogenase